MTLRRLDAMSGVQSDERPVGDASVGAICATANGDVLMAGALFGPTQLLESGPELTPAAGDIYVARVTPSLTVSEAGAVEALAGFVRGVVELNGEAFVAGYVAGPMSVAGEALPHAGLSDAVVIRFSERMQPLKGFALGGPSHDIFSGIAAGSDHVVVVGDVLGTINIDEALPDCGGVDAFMAKLNPETLAPMWIRRGGDESNQRIETVAIDSVDRITIGGVIAGELDLGLPLSSSDGDDGFVLQLSP